MIANNLFSYDGGAQRQEYRLSEHCLLCLVNVLIDKAKFFEKIKSFCTKTIHQQPIPYKTTNMTTNDLDSAVYNCTSERFFIGIRLTTIYNSKFNSSTKYASKQMDFRRAGYTAYHLHVTNGDKRVSIILYFL